LKRNFQAIIMTWWKWIFLIVSKQFNFLTRQSFKKKFHAFSSFRWVLWDSVFFFICCYIWSIFQTYQNNKNLFAVFFTFFWCVLEKVDELEVEKFSFYKIFQCFFIIYFICLLVHVITMTNRHFIVCLSWNITKWK